MSDLTMNAPTKLTGKHVLFALIGFFAVVIGVNVVFIVVALDSWTGLTTPTSYQEGLHYNNVIQDAEEQRARGWSADITVTRDAAKPDIYAVTVSALLTNKGGAPVAVDSATLSFRHPINEKYDQTLALTPGADGRYEGSAELPVAGNWDTRLSVRTADGTSFRQDGSIWIK
ncbi:FixH family protein [Nisaea sediminum]|uniref:FixH family protein n=1 Tax=Nisaea sediminum TaxID=2775867 RepID=UPI001868E8E8|nr:FixH family protein [Nisaea sediminum]